MTLSSLTCCTPFWLVRMPTFSVNTNQSPWRVTFRPRGFSNLLSLRSSAMEDEDIAATDFFFEPTLICTFLDETDFFELVTVVDVWDEDFIDVDIEEEEDWEMDFLEVCEDAVVEICFSNIGGGSLALVVWSAKISFSTSLAGGSETRRTWSTRTWMSQFRPGLTLPAAGWTGLRLEDVSTWQVNFMVLDCRSVERDCRVAVSPVPSLLLTRIVRITGILLLPRTRNNSCVKVSSAVAALEQFLTLGSPFSFPAHPFLACRLGHNILLIASLLSPVLNR